MPRNAILHLVDDIMSAAAPGAVHKSVRFDTDKIVGFTHTCPCGCGKHSFIRLNPENWVPGTSPMWQRSDDGGDDWSRMTLSPSIGIHPVTDGQYHWHGFLRNGVFEEC